MIIGLFAPARSGKTCVADHLVANHGFHKMSFAEPLKEMVISAGMCTREECYVTKTDHSRWILQKVGTDIFRKQVHEDYWVRMMEQHVHNFWKSAGGQENIVIDDGRFPNEAHWVRYMPDGITVRLIRENYQDPTAGNTHDSEALVATIPTDHVITAASGELQKLYDSIDRIVAGGKS